MVPETGCGTRLARRWMLVRSKVGGLEMRAGTDIAIPVLPHDDASAERRAPFTDTVRAHPWILALVLGVVAVLSAADGLLTTLELEARIAIEANPIMHALFSVHPAMALLFKLTMTVLVVAAMWHGRSSRLVTRIALATMFGYGALIAYHLGSLRGMGVL
jgi:hypothetical protein